MRKWAWICLCLVGWASGATAQTWEEDKARLLAAQESDYVSVTTNARHEKGQGLGRMVFNTALTVYQALFSRQLSTNCIYELSCSRFSREAIRQHGPFKGFFLTADRVTRCNGIHYEETSRLRRNASGKIVDRPESYTLRSE